MTRALPVIALLFVAACGSRDAAPPKSDNSAAEAPKPAADVPSLEGEWRVTRIEGGEATGLGMTALLRAGQATLATGCLRRAWTYTQKRNMVDFTSAPGGSANCGRAPGTTEETAYAVLDGASMAIFSRGGKEASLSGDGGTLTLERR